jgi:hypothetical protein
MGRAGSVAKDLFGKLGFLEQAHAGLAFKCRIVFESK